MTILRTTIGLPGSGKTTNAKEWVAEDPADRVRINRDDLRQMTHGGYLGTRVQEEQITSIRDASVLKSLRDGTSVVVDDTNLKWGHVERLRRIAARAQTEFEIVSHLDVSIDICVERDKSRPTPIGETIIMAMWANAIKNMCDTWRSRIVGNLTLYRHQNATTMVELAMRDPLDPKNKIVTDLAISYTNRKIAEYAPRS